MIYAPSIIAMTIIAEFEEANLELTSVGRSARINTDITKSDKEATDMTHPGEVTHTLQGYHLGETGKALRFQVFQINGETFNDGEAKTEWFPLSQVRSITRAAQGSGEMDNIKVTEWILTAKEMI